MVAVSNRRTGGLRARFLGSHLLVALVGALALAIASVAGLQAGDRAVELAEVQAPRAVSALRLMAGVERALADSRGWVLTGDPALQADAEVAWAQDIEPALAGLIAAYAEADVPHQESLEELVSELDQLRVLQWWVEDTARLPGNEPAKLLLAREVRVVEAELSAASSELAARALTPLGSRGLRNHAADAAGLQHDLGLAARTLERFVEAGDEADVERMERALARASGQLTRLARAPGLIPAETALLVRGRGLLTAWEALALRAVEIRRSPDWNIAIGLQSGEVRGVAAKLAGRLRVVAEREERAMAEAASEARASSRRTFYLLVFLGLALAGLSWRVSVTSASRLVTPLESLSRAARELARGSHAGRQIPVASDDEVGQLTVSFNEMRAAVEETSRVLREREAHLAAVVTSAVDGIITIDERGTIGSFNPGAERIFGWTAAEMAGRNVRSLMPDPDASAHDSYLANYVRTGKRKIIGIGREVVGLRRDGSTFPMALAVSAMETADGARSFVGLVRDISARKEAERRILESKEAAEAASVAKSRFLANMSHEIRTPLNGVIGMASILADSHLEGEQRVMAETITTSGRLLLDVVNDILDFSKIEAGELRLERSMVLLPEILDEVLHMHAFSAQSKRLELTGEVAPDLGEPLVGDAGRIRQILSNLVSNAIKFTATGEVVVTARLLEDRGETILLRFEVTDTGVGIPPDRIGKLFDAFTQADESTSRRYGGTGLGLSICRQLSELMGGSVGASSVPNEGSTFHVELLLPRATGDDLPITEDLDLAGRRVLVVDDNATNRRVVRHSFEAWDAVVSEAEQGEAGLEALRSAEAAGQSFDLVALDMAMPGLDGLEVGRAIVADPILEPGSVIMLTSLGDIFPSEVLQAAGIDVCLAKPVARALLMHTVARLVFGRGVAAGEADDLSAIPWKEGVRVLVAEDNPINQKVTQAQLTRLGLTGDVVANGQEALEALRRTQYSVVLMDCHMPVLDGYEATRAIRRGEQGGEEHIPIIAVTASVLSQERQLCADVGMDGYLSKPFTPRDLARVLKPWLRDPAALTSTIQALAAEELEPEPEPEPTVRMDPSALAGLRQLEEMTGEQGLVAGICERFREESDGRFAAITAAVEALDWNALKFEAHGLKGSAGTIGARRLADLLQVLESAGFDEGPEDVAVSTLVEARAELAAVLAVLPT